MLYPFIAGTKNGNNWTGDLLRGHNDCWVAAIVVLLPAQTPDALLLSTNRRPEQELKIWAPFLLYWEKRIIYIPGCM
jgi:hypothetical protein